MNKRTVRNIINWVMMISLIVVMLTGILLKGMPGMWMGILHALSGFSLTISIAVHCYQHRKPKKKAV